MTTHSLLYRLTAPVVMFLFGPWLRALLVSQYIGEWRIDSESGKRSFYIYSGGEIIDEHEAQKKEATI